MKAIINIGIIFIVLTFPLLASCEGWKSRVKSEYQSCIDYLDRISYNWSQDTMGNNGYRSCSVKEIKKCSNDLKGMSISKFVYIMGTPDKSFYQDGNYIVVYYLSRMPNDKSFPVHSRTKLLVVADTRDYLISDIESGLEEYTVKSSH